MKSFTVKVKAKLKDMLQLYGSKLILGKIFKYTF
jgi:hypothetical protein